MVFIAYSYHEFADPETTMEAVRRSLKPGGRLVVVEYAKENNLAPAAPLHKMSFDELRSEIEPMGFDLDRILDFLPMQHGLIFTVRLDSHARVLFRNALAYSHSHLMMSSTAHQ
jgi:SAM-dependent methyltransferase